MNHASRLAALRRAIHSEMQRLRQELAGVWSRTLRKHGGTPADQIYRFEPLERRQYLHAPTIDAIPNLTGTQGTAMEVDATYYHADWNHPPTGQIDYGDGTTDSVLVESEGHAHGEAVDSYVYQTPGEYTATLMLSDADGNSSLATFGVAVAT